MILLCTQFVFIYLWPLGNVGSDQDTGQRREEYIGRTSAKTLKLPDQHQLAMSQKKTGNKSGWSPARIELRIFLIRSYGYSVIGTLKLYTNVQEKYTRNFQVVRGRSEGRPRRRYDDNVIRDSQQLSDRKEKWLDLARNRRIELRTFVTAALKL